ncbi:hypothetical protein BJ546DRAFT_981103 [Cryomyces antarcticus]
MFLSCHFAIHRIKTSKLAQSLTSSEATRRGKLSSLLNTATTVSVPFLPIDLTASEVRKTRSIGDQLSETVKATKTEHPIKGMRFAQQHNIRLVVRKTGHDLLGRSIGYGSM